MSGKVTQHCRGCSACKSVCPVRAIEMRLSNEGFWTAFKTEKCIECGKCERFCQKVEASGTSVIDKPVFVGVSKDRTVLENSSSGGAGYQIALHSINQGGKVGGCVYDLASQAPAHIVTSCRSDLSRIQGSKYIQSKFEAVVDAIINGSFNSGVIFGTPCQIAGVHAVLTGLSKRSDFILVDFFCHGVPSVLAWRNHLVSLQKLRPTAGSHLSFSFRDNKDFVLTGFDLDDGEVVFRKQWREDAFYHLFLDGSIMAESCYRCSFRRKSCADVRIGDFATDEYKKLQYAPSSIMPLTEAGSEVVDSMRRVMQIDAASYDSLDAVQESGMKPIHPERNKRLLRLMDGEAPIDIVRFKVIASVVKGMILKVVSRS